MSDTAEPTKPATASEDSSPGPMTFDRMLLEKGDEPEKESKKVDPKSEPDADGDEEGDEPSDGETEESSEDGDDSSSEEEGESDSDADEGGDEKPEAEDAEEPGAEDLEAASKEAKGKTLALKLGGKDYQIPDSAKFSFEKDGKQISFSLKEAGNNLLTQREIDQQFSKLDREKKTHERRERDVTRLAMAHEDLQDKIELIKEAAAKGNMFDIAQAVLNFFAEGDQEVSTKLLTQVQGLMGTVGEMDENQLKTAIQNSQLSFNNVRLERQNKKTEAKLERSRQFEWLQKEIKSRGIEWEEYQERWTAFKALEKTRVERGLAPRLNDRMGYEDVAREVISFTLATRVYNKVTSAIRKVAPDRESDNQVVEAIAMLTEPSTSEKDLLEIVRGVLDVPDKKKVSKPVDSSKDVPKKAAAPKTEPAKKGATPEKAPTGKEPKKTEGGAPVTYRDLIAKYDTH